jgi:hypothetical protein
VSHPSPEEPGTVESVNRQHGTLPLFSLQLCPESAIIVVYDRAALETDHGYRKHERTSRVPQLSRADATHRGTGAISGRSPRSAVGIGGWYKFSTTDKKLADVSSQLASTQNLIGQAQLTDIKEQRLQLSGRVMEASASGYYSERPFRRITVIVGFQNMGQSPLELGNVEFRVFRRILRQDWSNVRYAVGSPPAVLQPLTIKSVAPPRRMPDDEEESRTRPHSSPPPSPNLLGCIDLYSCSETDWTEAFQSIYDPTKHTGGQLLRGQRRSLGFDLLVQDGRDTPELVKFEVTANPSRGNGQTWPKQTWVGWVGCGPLKGLFESSREIRQPPDSKGEAGD